MCNARTEIEPIFAVLCFFECKNFHQLISSPDIYLTEKEAREAYDKRNKFLTELVSGITAKELRDTIERSVEQRKNPEFIKLLNTK